MGNRLPARIVYSIDKSVFDWFCRLKRNLDSFQNFSAFIEKTLNLTLRKKFHPEFKPLNESVCSLSSFTSLKEGTEISFIDENGSCTSDDLIKDEENVESIRKDLHCARCGQVPSNEQTKDATNHVLLSQHQDVSIGNCNCNERDYSRISVSNGVNSYCNKTDNCATAQSTSDQLTAVNNNYQVNNARYNHLGYYLYLNDILSPRQRKKTSRHTSMKNLQGSYIFGKSFTDDTLSKEQKKQLKKKMRDVIKRPETYVILGLL